MKMSYYKHCKTNIDMSFYHIDIIKNSIYNAYNDKKIYNKLEHIEYLFHNLYKICNELEVHTRALRDKLQNG
jgi:hypothetical protein